MIDFKAKNIIVGHFIVQGPSPLETRCPGYYAADMETYYKIPGRYPIYLNFEFVGWTMPMPRITVHADCYATKCVTYSGFGGVNFASKETGPEPTRPIVFNPFTLKDLVESGKAEMLPGFDFLALEFGAMLDMILELWKSDIERRLKIESEAFRAQCELERLHS